VQLKQINSAFATNLNMTKSAMAVKNIFKKRAYPKENPVTIYLYSARVTPFPFMKKMAMVL